MDMYLSSSETAFSRRGDRPRLQLQLSYRAHAYMVDNGDFQILECRLEP